MNQVTSIQPVSVEFQGQSIEAVQVNKRVWVSLKKLCQNMGIKALDKQIKKVQQDPTFDDLYRLMPVQHHSGSKETFMLDLEALPFWLGSIQINRVSNGEVKKRLIAYRQHCVQVLRDYFFGNADNSSTQTSTSELVGVITKQMNLIQDVLRELIETRKQNGLLLRQLRQDFEEHGELPTVAEQEASLITVDTLPSPTVGTTPRTVRANINIVVRDIAARMSMRHQDVWNDLYKQFKYSEGKDLKARARHDGCRPLDIAEKEGLLDLLYAHAVDMYDLLDDAEAAKIRMQFKTQDAVH